jgi:drug/metabolite transporter (DMT)-like permease
MRPASQGVVAWYAASLGNNYATPALLDLLGSPLALNVVEQATMSLIALVVLPTARVKLPTWKTMQSAGLRAIVLMGMCNALTCRLFMVSLHHLDVSLCHTIRACNPILAAMIGLMHGKQFSRHRLCSLPLMLSGFAIAVAAQPSCSAIGVAAAIGSLLSLSALQHLTHHHAPAQCSNKASTKCKRRCFSAQSVSRCSCRES